MINVIFNSEKLQNEIREKISKNMGLLLEFSDDISPIVNDVARKDVLSKSGKDTLGIVSGNTQREGFMLKRFKRKGKSNMAGETFWSHMSNIWANRKDRKSKPLLRKLKSEFMKDSRVMKIFYQTLEKFGEINV